MTGRLTLAVLVIMVVVACEKKTEEPLTAPLLAAVSQEEGCLATAPAAFVAAPGIVVYAKGKELEVVHERSSFNCCHAAIRKELTYDEATETITLTEREVQGEATCECDCAFEVWWRVKLHKIGTFTIAVQRLADSGSGTVIYSQKIPVTGQDKQLFPAHDTPDIDTAYPDGYPDPDWPETVSEVTPKYLSDETLLTIFSLAEAKRTEPSGQIQYKTDDAMLTITETAAEHRVSYTVLRERTYFVAKTKEGYDAKHAELLSAAQEWADKLTTFPFFRLPTVTPYDDDPEAADISFAATYQFGAAVAGFWDQSTMLSVSFDAQGFIGAEFSVPNEVVTGAAVPAATKDQIATALSEELSITADPVVEQIRWRPVDENSPARMLRYYYINSATGGLYSISMKKSDHP